MIPRNAVQEMLFVLRPRQLSLKSACLQTKRVTVHSRSVLRIDERLVGFAVEFCGDRLVQTVKEATPLFSAGGDG